MSSAVDVNGSLTPSEERVLDVLQKAARPMPMRAIAEQSMLPKGTVGKALCELKREGWIVARVNPLDPRGDIYQVVD